MFHKNKQVYVLTAALFTVFLFSGCDINKDQRASLIKQKNQ